MVFDVDREKVVLFGGLVAEVSDTPTSEMIRAPRARILVIPDV